MTNTSQLFEKYRDRARKLMELDLQDMLDKLNATVSAMLDVAQTGAEGFDPSLTMTEAEQLLQLIVTGMDQIIDRGNDEIAPIIDMFVYDLGVDAVDWAEGLGVSTDTVLPQIVNLTQAEARMNDWNLIRQITPQVRADVINVFHEAMFSGRMHPDSLAIDLLNVGLPHSPVMKYSPGQRAVWIANNEVNRIFNSMNERIRKEAKITGCVNRLNPAAMKHSIQCIAATAAGWMTVDDMRRKYGMPSRHFNCQCDLDYIDKKYYTATLNQMDLSMLKDKGVDIEAASAEWEAKGTAAMQAEQAWRDHLHWENDTMSTIFG